MTTILIIEDDKEINNMLSEFLNKHGYNTLGFYDGLHALDIIKQRKIDLILLDIMLPYKSGNQILNEICSYSTIPILIISAKETTFFKESGWKST